MLTPDERDAYHSNPVNGLRGSRHTPGPWYADEKWITTGERAGVHRDGSGGAHNVVAEAFDCGPALREDNSRLIAAAPDLLVALQWYIETGACACDTPAEHSALPCGHCRARAAIEKALGTANESPESEPSSPEATCPYCGETGGEPLEITSREFQGEPGHGGFVEWREERCSLCVRGWLENE